GVLSFDGRVEPRAEKRVHHQRRALELRANRVERGGARALADAAAGATPRDERLGGVAAHGVGGGSEPHLDRPTGALQMSGDDEAVAAVVPTSAHDDRAAAL